MSYKVKELREKKNMTQTQLSEISGVSRAILCRLESEKDITTTTTTLKKIAAALECQVSDIFFESGVQHVRQEDTDGKDSINSRE